MKWRRKHKKTSQNIKEYHSSNGRSLPTQPFMRSSLLARRMSIASIIAFPAIGGVKVYSFLRVMLFKVTNNEIFAVRFL